MTGSIRICQAVLDAHAQFGGDLEIMQKVYEWPDLKGEIERLRTALSEAEQRVKDARRVALEEAAAICDQESAHFRKLGMDESCLNDSRWDHREEAQFTMEAYAERHETDAVAIRALQSEKR